MSGEREIDPAHLEMSRAAGHAQRLAGYLFQTGAYMISRCHLAARTKEDAMRELGELCEALGLNLTPINNPSPDTAAGKQSALCNGGNHEVAPEDKAIREIDIGLSAMRRSPQAPCDPGHLFDCISTEPNGDIAGRG